jgi:hypothetical protein
MPGGLFPRRDAVLGQRHTSMRVGNVGDPGSVRQRDLHDYGELRNSVGVLCWTVRSGPDAVLGQHAADLRRWRSMGVGSRVRQRLQRRIVHRDVRAEFHAMQWSHSTNVQQCRPMGFRIRLHVRLQFGNMYRGMCAGVEAVQRKHASILRLGRPVAERKRLSVPLQSGIVHRGVFAWSGTLYF